MYFCVGGILIRHFQHFTVAERCWHVVHTDICCILLGLWYRSPGADARDIISFDDALSRVSLDMNGVLVVGGMYICHKSWLKHSPVDIADVEKPSWDL